MITDTGWWIHEIHFSTFLMFKTFFIIKVFVFFFFFLTTWMGPLFLYEQTPLQLATLWGSPAASWPNLNRICLKENVQRVTTRFPRAGGGEQSPWTGKGGIRAPFGGASPDPSLLHLWPERGPPSSWVFPSCCLEWNPGSGSYSLVLEETPQIQWGLSL